MGEMPVSQSHSPKYVGVDYELEPPAERLRELITQVNDSCVGTQRTATTLTARPDCAQPESQAVRELL